jgi:hypothetical protein
MGTKEETILETDSFLDRKVPEQKNRNICKMANNIHPRIMQDGSHLRTNLNFQV